MAVMHVCAVTGDDRLLHTIRNADGSWLPWGDVEAQTGDIGHVGIAAASTANGELHVCAVTQGGGLMHTLRRADGSWLKFGDVEGQAGNIPVVTSTAASAAANGDLHVCAVTTAGRLMHTIRRADGSWLPFGDVETQTGPLGAAAGQVRQVAVSARANGLLHVAVLAQDGADLRLSHIVRRADGSWSNFGDVEGPGQAGPAGAVRGRVGRIAVSATSNGDLHLCAVRDAVANGQLMHTVRRADGSWFPFGDVEGQAGDIANVFDTTASTTATGELHVCALTLLNPNTSRLNHTIRRADGSWLPFGDVETQAGDVGQAGNLSGEIRSATISGR